MKIILLSIVAFFTMSAQLLSSDISRLTHVYQMLDAARTQAELNSASEILVRIWNEELSEKENEVIKILSKASVKKFKQSMSLWRKHVEHMSSMRAELFKGQVIDPKNMDLRIAREVAGCTKCTTEMVKYVYNMSKSIYYEEKWSELDILINHD